LERRDPLHGFEESLRAMLSAAEPVATEKIPLRRATGRLLAEPIAADRDLPPFDRSERDGWAVRCADLSGEGGTLSWDGAVLYAGDEPGAPLPAGGAVRIMTGAPLPQGADAVVMIEKSRVRGDRVELSSENLRPGLHVHKKGVDAATGTVLVPAGHPLTPNRIALAASVGASDVIVRRRVRVSLIITGDEVVPAASTPSAVRIRDGNGPASLAILLSNPWADAGEPIIVSDEESALTSALIPSLERSDLVVLSGGVSEGDKDLVPHVLARLGVRKVLHKMAIRPGKPLWFGLAGETVLVFGLPGNPASFQVTFRELVLPALRRLAGFARPEPTELRLPLGAPIEKSIPLRQFLPAQLESANGRTLVLPIPHHGSGDAVAVARADGVIVLAEGPCRFRPGDLVPFHHWGLS
jgi:molybdopterin molybdotransferase